MRKRLLSPNLNQIYVPASINVHTGLGPEVIKLFSYSTQLSMKLMQLINVKMPTFDADNAIRYPLFCLSSVLRF